MTHPQSPLDSTGDQGIDVLPDISPVQSVSELNYRSGSDGSVTDRRSLTMTLSSQSNNSGTTTVSPSIVTLPVMVVDSKFVATISLAELLAAAHGSLDQMVTISINESGGVSIENVNVLSHQLDAHNNSLNDPIINNNITMSDSISPMNRTYSRNSTVNSTFEGVRDDVLEFTTSTEKNTLAGVRDASELTFTSSEGNRHESKAFRNHTLSDSASSDVERRPFVSVLGQFISSWKKAVRSVSL